MTLSASLPIVIPLLGRVLLVNPATAAQMTRAGRGVALAARESERTWAIVDRRSFRDLRGFLARAGMSRLDLAGLKDDGVSAMVRQRLRDGSLVLFREGEGVGRDRAHDKTATLRALVRAIDGQGALSHAGRSYRLVVDVDFPGSVKGNSHEVVPREEAVHVLRSMADAPSASRRLREDLHKASEKLTEDWRPPFAPDGLILLRRGRLLQGTRAEEAAITPSQMARLLKKKDWIEIEVVYDDDKPYTGPYRVTHPDGRKDEGRFSPPMWSAHEIEPGTFKLDLPARTGTVADDELVLDDPAEDKTARRVRLGGMLFDANKCFLLPQALPGIKDIVAMHEREPDAEVLIVGHAGGDEDLAGADIAFDRAQILGAFLMNKPNIWLNWFGPDKKARSRWGTREIQLMLSVLPDTSLPYYEGYASGLTDEKTKAAIKSFQELTNQFEGTNLPTDGQADFETRKAIVEAYMGLAETSLAEDVIPIAHGCEGHFDDTPPASGIVDDRRLEVFFFKDQIDPKPSARTSSAGSPSYASWLALLVETKDFENHGIHVQIVDSKKQPVPLAKVQLSGPTNAEATADEHGFVSFFGLKQGEYVIRSEKNGYKVGESKLTYPTAKTVPGHARKAA